MTFPSVLFAGAAGPIERPVPATPDCLADLNLDQIVAGSTAGRERHHLRSDFTCTLLDEAILVDRQRVFRDIGRGILRAGLDRFAARMDRVRRELAQADALRHRHQVARWRVDAADDYRCAVVDLHGDLVGAELRSAGLRAVRDRLTELIDDTPFRTLCADLDSVRPALASVRYELHIVANQIRVRPGGATPDYTDAVTATFRRFRQGDVQNHLVTFPDHPAMNHVEEGVLDLVAEVYPEVFAELDRFARGHADVVDDEVAGFDRDIQFFLRYLDYIEPMVRAGLPFCHPAFDRPADTRERTIEAIDTFDLALAATLTRSGPGRRPRSATTSPWSAVNASCWSPGPTMAARRPSPGPSASCTIWPGWAYRFPASPPGFFCATTCSPISRGRRRPAPGAASCRTSWCACMRSSRGRPAKACWS